MVCHQKINKQTAIHYCFLFSSFFFALLSCDGVAYATPLVDTIQGEHQKVHVHNCSEKINKPQVDVKTDPPFSSFTVAFLLSCPKGGGIHVDYLPARHHSIRGGVAGFFVDYKVGIGEKNLHLKVKNLGGEFGYRLYSGGRGANGCFVGFMFYFSKLFMSIPGNHLDIGNQSYPIENMEGTLWSPGVDLGWRCMWDSGFNMEMGIGIMKLFFNGKVKASELNQQERLENAVKNELKSLKAKNESTTFLLRLDNLLTSEKFDIWFPHFFITLGYSF